MRRNEEPGEDNGTVMVPVTDWWSVRPWRPALLQTIVSALQQSIFFVTVQQLSFLSKVAFVQVKCCYNRCFPYVLVNVASTHAYLLLVLCGHVSNFVMSTIHGVKFSRVHVAWAPKIKHNKKLTRNLFTMKISSYAVLTFLGPFFPFSYFFNFLPYTPQHCAAPRMQCHWDEKIIRRDRTKQH